jgi:hypothetical protein
MIKHIVIFQLAEFAEGKTKQENAVYIKEILENLKSSIPQIITLEVGINIPDFFDGNQDLVIYSEFANIQDLKTYMEHPEHKKVANYIGKVRIARTSVDYEV